MLDRPQPPPATCRDNESSTLEKESSIPILTHQKTSVKQTGQNYDPVAALEADSTDPRLACS